MKYAPIIFLCYNRPQHAKRVLESLARNQESKESELHIFIDAPKNSESSKKAEEVHSVVEIQKWCKCVTIMREQENRGCAGQFIEKVTRFCEENGRVILLENDN